MREILERLRELYNAALQERIAWYRATGTYLSGYAQNREFRELRAVRPEYASIHTHLLQNATRRLDRAYRGFFRRCRAGEKPGFPRFKGRGRYRTFTFPDVKNNNGVQILAGGKRVYLSGIGKVKVKLHRQSAGIVKQVSVTLGSDDRWYVSLACADVPSNRLPNTGMRVGIDVGISSFLSLSNGESVDNPRWFESAERDVAKAQRRVARRKRGSVRKNKATRMLARRHAAVRVARYDFHHKLARTLVSRFDAIAVENLNIAGLGRMRLAKQVHDAGWGQFISILADKAESAGREFIKVDPRGTSQRCSGCGIVVPKTLSVRIHDCPDCGLVLDRDVNAARNIERLGQSLRGEASSKRLDEPRSLTVTQ